MARPLRIQYSGAVYHITQRGNDGQAIFRDDDDRERFLELLALSLSTFGVRMHSYVLMTNHFHLLLETPRGNLGECMRHFNISYTSYFNRRHQRIGHLYQGRYKSFLIEKDAYLAAVSRYIHLNPVKVGTIRKKTIKAQLAFLRQFPWSSLPGFVGTGERNTFTEYRQVLEEYGGDTAEGCAAYLRQLVTDLTRGVPIRESLVGQCLLGSDEFIEEIDRKHLSGKQDRECPALGMVQRYVARDRILAVLAEELDIPVAELLSTRGPARQIAMDVLYRLGGLRNAEIGIAMGLHYSTISQGRKRLQERLQREPSLQETLARIEAILSK